MNIWDVLLSAAVIAALALAVALCVRKKTRGGGCCGSCARCQNRRGDADQLKKTHFGSFARRAGGNKKSSNDLSVL